MLALATPATAQEFIDVPGPLNDEAFYRAVACAAAPGETCRKPFLRWPEARRGAITVVLRPLPEGTRDGWRALYEEGLETAIAEVNGLGAGISLRRVSASGDIRVHIIDTDPGSVIRDTGVRGLDGTVLPLGRVTLRAREGVIQDALIAVSLRARRHEVASVILEELVQSLGLMTDIRSPAYRRLSLFSEDGNSVTRIEGQDAMALRRHYETESEES